MSDQEISPEEPETDEVLAHSAEEDEDGAGCVGQFNAA